MATKQRGRPRSFDREDALRKATLAFWEQGYEATSIADLTRVMGIAAPSLYAAFATAARHHQLNHLPRAGSQRGRNVYAFADADGVILIACLNKKRMNFGRRKEFFRSSNLSLE